MDDLLSKLISGNSEVILDDRKKAMEEFQEKIDNGMKPDSAEGQAAFLKFFMWSLMDKDVTGEEPVNVARKILEDSGVEIADIEKRMAED